MCVETNSLLYVDNGVIRYRPLIAALVIAVNTLALVVVSLARLYSNNPCLTMCTNLEYSRSLIVAGYNLFCMTVCLVAAVSEVVLLWI